MLRKLPNIDYIRIVEIRAGQGRQTLGRGPVPVREEIVTGPCGTKSKLVQK